MGIDMSVPKLRFKHDREKHPDWQEESLLNLSESGFSNGVFNDPTKVGRGYKLINVLDMYIESTIDDNKLNLVELSKDEFNRNKVKYGDIFFTRSSLVKEGIAHSNIYLSNSQDVTFDGHLIKMSPKKDFINPIFFYFLLKTSKVRKQLVKRGKTTTMTTIGQADIATVKVAFPEVKEQIKIADFLITIDQKIAQLTQKFELLTRYKKGVMQQLFNQKLRFKDDGDRNFPDWEEKTLAQANIKVIDGDRGEKYPNGDDFSDDGYCLFLNAKNVTKSGFIFNEVSFITKQKDEELRKGKLIRNDLIITTRGTVGNIAYYDKNVKHENIRINSGMVIIRNSSDAIQTNYLYKYFNSPRFRKMLEQIAFGSAQPQLTVAEINLKLVFLF